MSQEEFSEYREGARINLVGYTSTTKSRETAIKFAFEDLGEGVAKIPVVFDIEFHGPTGLLELTDDYTAYPGENEVLVQDGLSYLVKDIKEKCDVQRNKTYFLVILEYR